MERSLVRNCHNLKARALKGMILAQMGREAEAAAWYVGNLKLDAFDYVSRIESGDAGTALSMMGGRASSYIECAIDYAEAGFYRKAVDVLEQCPAAHPMVSYHKALCLSRAGLGDAQALREAADCGSLYCFPNKLEDIPALRHAMGRNPGDSKAPYYLGCLLYDRQRFDEAITCWESSAALDTSFPTVWRNLALAYFNKRGEKQLARECLEKAYALDETDVWVLLELDQLYHKIGIPVE